MTDPAVRLVVSVVTDEHFQALRGEAAIVVSDDTIWQHKFPQRDIEGHATAAVLEMLQQARGALEVAAGSRAVATPPSSAEQPRRKKRQPTKGTGASAVSRSRLR